jgi:hypothetical protein
VTAGRYSNGSTSEASGTCTGGREEFVAGQAEELR